MYTVTIITMPTIAIYNRFGTKECIILKKKLLAILMSTICMFALSACTTNDNNTGADNTTNPSTTGNGIVDDAGDVVEDAGDAVNEAGDDVSSAARNAMDDMRDNMSTTNNNG